MYLRLLVVALLIVVFRVAAFSQAITTQPLNTSAACPGTSITVPFVISGAFAGNNVFTVQVASGADFASITTSSIVGNSATGQYTATATLPVTPGTYRVRVVGSSPAATGSVSAGTLLVKTQPTTAPTLTAQAIGNFTSQYTFCQNDKPLLLSDLVGPAPDNYRVQYDIGTSGTPTAQRTLTAPTITPTNVGRTTYNFRYVVIDEAKGCNPVEQAGTIAYLFTEVKQRPGAPNVPASALTYCQNQAAGGLQATTTATGAELVWYTPDNAVLPGTSPAPQTAQVGTNTYQVSQSLDRCEGPRASVSVAVRAASAPPTAPKTQLELCRGATAPPLIATGTNLIWTEPTGTTSAVAPTPSTLNASKTADGDAYYVTQTGATGCPSSRLTIRVVVQAQPTLSLSGGATVNLGTELPLRLTFGGTGPYRYRITSGPGSNTLTGGAMKDTTLLLLPERSGTYQVAEVSNGCGAGLPGNPATATVTVLIPTIRTSALQTATACAGGSVTVPFQTTGTFNAGSVFRLQVARTNPDTTQVRFEDLVTVQQAGTFVVTGTLPTTATAGTYLVRVVATNPKISILGAASTNKLIVKGLASATLATSTPTITAGEVAKLSVSLTGDGPWTFTYRDSTNVLGAIQTVTTTTSPSVFDAKPTRTTVYRLTGLSNGCTALNSLLGRVVVTVSPVLAVEPLTGLIDVFPVPAHTYLTVRINAPLMTPATLELTDAAGRLVGSQQTTQAVTAMPVGQYASGYASGVYLLRIRVNGQIVTKRVSL